MAVIGVEIYGGDLYTVVNPEPGWLIIGIPQSGTYASIWCQKDNSGTITPIGIGGGIPQSQTFIATVSQQIFTPAGFTPTTNSKVYQNGARITTGFDVTTNPGSVTFTVGQQEGIEIVIDQF